MRPRRLVGATLAVTLVGLIALVESPHAGSAAIGQAAVKAARGAAGRAAAGRAATGAASCPTSTYPGPPGSPTANTGYGVAFSAAILNGTLNVGYHENAAVSNPKDLYSPWSFHLSNVTGTVCGLLELPSLTLSVSNANVHINTVGTTLSGPSNLAGHGGSASYTFTGLADPGSQEALLSVLTGGGDATSAIGLAPYHASPAQSGLTVPAGDVLLQSKPATASTPVKLVASTTPVPGQVTIINTSGRTVTSIEGTVPTGFVTPAVGTPTDLAPGATGTYDFTMIDNVDGEGGVPITFRGSTTTGPVEGFGVAYYDTEPTSLTVSGMTITPDPLAPGQPYTGTVTLTNTGGAALTDITGSTNQAADLYVVIGNPPNSSLGPLALAGFGLTVAIPSPLTTNVKGVLPDGALSATASATADGTFTATDPPLTCASDVTSGLTTGVSQDVPTGRGASSAWTMQGQAVEGPLSSATAQLVSNNFPLDIPANPKVDPACGIYGELFDQVIGGVDSVGHYYNGTVPEYKTYAPPGEAQLTLNVQLTAVDLPVASPSILSTVAHG